MHVQGKQILYIHSSKSTQRTRTPDMSRQEESHDESITLYKTINITVARNYMNVYPHQYADANNCRIERINLSCNFAL